MPFLSSSSFSLLNLSDHGLFFLFFCKYKFVLSVINIQSIIMTKKKSQTTNNNQKIIIIKKKGN